MKLLSSALIIAGAVVSINAQADSLGFAHGRSADVSEYGAFSVEGAAQLGDADNFGVRASAKLNDSLAVYGDFGFMSLDHEFLEGLDDNGKAFGGGVVYEIKDLFPKLATAIIVSYHMFGLDETVDDVGVRFSDSGSIFPAEDVFDGDMTSLGLRGAISGNIPTQGSMLLVWYATAGFERVSFELEECYRSDFFEEICESFDDSSTDLVFGGGVVAKFGPGEGYVGGEYINGDIIDGISLAAGYRMNF